MKQFSDQLIQKLIVLFQTEYGIVLAPETADEYLDAYAELFLSFANNDHGGAVAGIHPRPELHNACLRPLGEGAQASVVKRRSATATDLINSTLNENA